MAVKVSIVVPIYNVAAYLDKCMESLCNQSLTDIEILAVNDRSPDNSDEILAKWAALDSRVKVITNKQNLKTAATRNAGIDAATGEYICFVDGDDYLDSDFCEKLYNLAKVNDADIAKGVVRHIYSDRAPVENNDNIAIRQSKFNFFGRVWLGLYNRTRLIEAHNIRFHIDFFCFQIQALYYTNAVVCCDDAFYNYLHREGSCDSEIFSIEKWQRLNLGHAKFIYNWVNSHEYDDSVRKAYLNRVKMLYFYGFNKLANTDIACASHILAENMRKEYDCEYDTTDIKKLRRQLFRENKNSNTLNYLVALIKKQI